MNEFKHQNQEKTKQNINMTLREKIKISTNYWWNLNLKKIWEERKKKKLTEK